MSKRTATEFNCEICGKTVHTPRAGYHPVPLVREVARKAGKGDFIPVCSACVFIALLHDPQECDAQNKGEKP